MSFLDATYPFQADLADPDRRIWHASQRRYRLTLVNAVMTVLFILATTGRMAWARIREDRHDSLAMTMVVIVLLGLVLVVIVTWRRRTELRGNAITLGKGWLALRPARETGLLPSHADARLTVPYASVTAIESRSVRHWFHAERVFRLLRRDGPPLFLFEDRGMDTY